MPECRCSLVVNTVVIDGVKEPIPCGKPARRRMVVDPGYDAGFWLDGCCEDCVKELRDVVHLTEEEIELLYPVSGEAVRWWESVERERVNARL